MYAISIHQPTAILIASRFLKVHPRGWTTSHRGPILIHASKIMTEQDEKLLKTHAIQQHLSRHNLPLHFGAIIGQADLTDIVPAQDIYQGNSPYNLSETDWSFANIRDHDNLMFFANQKLLRPYFVRAQPNLFEVSQYFTDAPLCLNEHARAI